MSLATRCPACGTAFRVVQDQLKISGGWVRCGQCHQVFNGLESLLDWPGAAAAPASPPPTALDQAQLDERTTSPVSTPPEPAYQATEPMPLDLPDHAPQALPDVDLADTPAAPPDHPAQAPAQTPAYAPAEDDEPEASRIPTGIAVEHESVWSRFEAASAGPTGIDLTHDVPDSEPDFEPVIRGVPPFRHTAIPLDALPSRLGPAGPAETDPAPPAPSRGKRRRKPGFVRQAERAAQWRRPAVRAVLGSAAAVLALILAAQVMYDYRDELSARVPALQGPLASGCRWLRCRIEPPRALARLTLDSSSLSKTGNSQVLRFEADLRNQADHAVRAPALELSFNDLQGRVVVRKVLLPDELAAPPGGLAADASWHVDTRLLVGDLRIAGFSAEVFYP